MGGQLFCREEGRKISSFKKADISEILVQCVHMNLRGHILECSESAELFSVLMQLQILAR